MSANRIEIINELLDKAVNGLKKQILKTGKMGKDVIPAIGELVRIEKDLKDILSKELPIDTQARSLSTEDLLNRAKNNQ